MDVDHLIRITTHDLVWNVAEVTGERDELDAVALEQRTERRALDTPRRRQRLGGDATDSRSRQRTGVGTVAGDEHDVAAPPIAEPIEMIDNRL